MRWNFSYNSGVEPSALFSSREIKIRNPAIASCPWLVLIPVDWGPAWSTGRLIDVSPKVLKLLQCETDSIVECDVPRNYLLDSVPT
jgi:hypothetical protein